MSRAYRHAVRCVECRAYLDRDECELSWLGRALCVSCARAQPPANVALARRSVGGPLAARRGHLALATHALGWAGASGAAGVVLGVFLLVSGADQARRGSLLVLSLGLLLIASSFVSIEDAALERWKHLIPRRQRRAATSLRGKPRGARRHLRREDERCAPGAFRTRNPLLSAREGPGAPYEVRRTSRERRWRFPTTHPLTVRPRGGRRRGGARRGEASEAPEARVRGAI